MPPPEIEIHGYAIVSDDDLIAGLDGRTPPSLRNAADWDYFQRELDRADLVALSRVAHEAYPDVRGRRRLVLSRSSDGLQRRGAEWWWNPDLMSWREASTALLPTGGRVAVPGGQAAFDRFMDIGYDAFNLTRAHGVLLGGGRALFAACGHGSSAVGVLTRAGLRPGAPEILDAAADVTLTVWRRR